MAVYITKNYATDLDLPIVQQVLFEPLMQQDKGAHRFEITVKHGTTAEALSGCTVQAYFIRSDGATVVFNGSVSSGKAVITLPESCYVAVGAANLIVRVSTDTERITVLWLSCTVNRTTTDAVVDPGQVIPSLAELLAKIAACEAATVAANAAAAKINGLTVSAAVAQTATAVVTLVDGHYNIAFGIPRGEGNYFHAGTAITGQSTTPTAYPTGITEANAGDRYYYNGSNSADIGNVYRCTLGGAASTALWVYDQNIRGEAGSGAVSTVNGISPVAGNVSLAAANIPYGDTDVDAALDGKAEAAHTHAIADVTGLVAALAGKASVAAATGTLTVAGWENNVQTVSVTGVTADNMVIVTASGASYIDWHTAQVRCTAQGAGTLTFTCTDTPTAELTANVLAIS